MSGIYTLTLVDNMNRLPRSHGIIGLANDGVHRQLAASLDQSREDRAQAPDRGHGQIDWLVYELYGLKKE
jgi:hypothetical protein